jgi:hypothetical protein
LSKFGVRIGFSVLIVLLGISLLSNVMELRRSQNTKSEFISSELNSAFNYLGEASDPINKNDKLAAMRLSSAVSIFYLLQTPLAKAGVNHTTEVAVALNAADMEIAFPSIHSPQEVQSMKEFVQAAARDGRKMLQPHISMSTAQTVMNQIYKDIPQTQN